MNDAKFYVTLQVTLACEYNCMHCIASAIHDPSPNELTLPEIDEIIAELSSMKDVVPELILTGGDPMLRKDLRRIIQHVKIAGISYYVMPSASPLVSGEFMDFLRTNKASGIIISMDGADEKIHDSIRRSVGSLDLTIYLLKEAKKHGLRVIVSTTIMEQNLMNLPNVAATLNDLGITEWVLIFLVNRGRASSMSNIGEDQNCAVSMWASSLSSYGFNIHVINDPESSFSRVRAYSELGHEGKTLLNMLKRRTSEIICHKNLRIRKKVPDNGVKGEIYVTEDGRVYDSIFHGKVLGNIRSEKLSDIIERVMNGKTMVVH